MKIKKFDDYEIFEDGTVVNLKTNKSKKPYLNKRNGYLYVDLYKNGKSYKRPIHRLLAESFIPNPDKKPTVDHKDGNRTNNALFNLRWATYSEQNSRFDTVGIRSERIKVTKLEEIRKKRGGGHISWGNPVEVRYFNRIMDCASYFGVTISNISLMLKKGEPGRRGKMRGYLFEYDKCNL